MINQDESLRICNRAAARLLAAAVTSLCPGVYAIEGRDEPLGFSYDFIFTQSFSEEAFPLLEEKIRHLIEANLSIEMLEMVPKNAAELFRHKRRYYPASFAQHSQETLVTLFQAEDFVDLCPPPYPKLTSELGLVKLYRLSKRPPLRHKGNEKEVLRIHGCAFPTHETLKEFLKDKENLLGQDHRVLGQKLDLFILSEERGKSFHEIQTCLWRGKGEEVLASLGHLWRSAYQKRNFELTFGPPKAFLKQGIFRFAQLSTGFSDSEVDPDLGLYRSKDSFVDAAWTLCQKESLVEEVISSLKFLGKIPKIFGFKVESVFSYDREEVKRAFEAAFEACQWTPKIQKQKKVNHFVTQVTDCFGRKWELSSLEVIKEEGKWMLKESAFGSLQRLIALILESGEKDLSQKKHILSKLKDFNLE